jgi:hypothetical protein
MCVAGTAVTVERGAMRGFRQAVLWAVPAVFLALSALVAGRISSIRLSPEGDAAGACGGLFALISKTPSFSFGFCNLLSDISWLEAVQAAGNKNMKEADYRLLSCKLNIVVDFDPRFSMPYLLGGLVLSESPGHAREAFDLLDKGRPHHADDWRFPFYMGYIQYFSFGDSMSAGYLMREASRMYGSPSYVPLLATRMLSEARNPEAALDFLAAAVASEFDPIRRAALERRMRDVMAERDLQMLERAVEGYRRKTGVPPESLRSLVESGLISSVPPEPHGGRYLLEPGGKVRSDMMEQRLRVFKQQ